MRSPNASKKVIVHAFSALLAFSLVLPAKVSAKEKRGARLVVTRIDGYRVEGELLAVRPDSLHLLGFAGGDESVDLADVKSIRIRRKAHTGSLVLGGLAAGAVGGAIFGSQSGGSDNFDNPALLGAVFVGVAGALAGLAASIPLGADTTFAVAGEPEEIVKSRLDRLSRFSRESRNRK